MLENKIKFVDLQRQYKSIEKLLNDSVEKVLSSGRYIGGEELTKFERKFCAYIGSKFGFGVGSGSDALIIALQSLGVGKGDKVVTVPFTFVSTVDAILHVGAQPIFVDIDPETYTLDINKLRKSLDNSVKAIIPVHLYGNPSNMDEIMELAKVKGIFVIEDAAQAHGATVKGRKVGTLGEIACFSFYPAKNLGAAGDGGFITTNDAEIGEKIRLLREYGQKEKYFHDILGWNSRLDPIQAAILSIKLEYLDRWNRRRNRLAEIYIKELTGTRDISFQSVPEENMSVYHIFSIFTGQRDQLRIFLEKSGVETGIHYPVPVHRQKYYQSSKKPLESNLEISEFAATHELSLPLFPELGEDELFKVIEYVKEYLRSG